MDRIPPEIRNWFSACPRAITAFSGGVDSSLVAVLANRLLGPERHTAVISASPSLKLSDLDEAKAFAALHRIPLRIIETQELLNPDYASNPVNRCFTCKHTLYTELEGLALAEPGTWILNGTNTDDLGDYRPGLQAAAQFEVRSPLVECGFDKQAVRDLAETLELECWNKPAAPCLSSRIPYGQRVTLEKLRRIEAAEDWLQNKGFAICRVRHVDEASAVVEVPQERVPDLQALAESMTAAFTLLGFQETVIDAEGFVSGKLNRVLTSGTS
jgi:uncharacterized protein